MASEWKGWEVRTVTHPEWAPRVFHFEPAPTGSETAHPVTITPTPLAEARARVIEVCLMYQRDLPVPIQAAMEKLQREEARDGS